METISASLPCRDEAVADDATVALRDEEEVRACLVELQENFRRIGVLPESGRFNLEDLFQVRRTKVGDLDLLH